MLSRIQHFFPRYVYLEEKTRPSQHLTTPSDVSVNLGVEVPLFEDQNRGLRKFSILSTYPLQTCKSTLLGPRNYLTMEMAILNLTNFMILVRWVSR